MCALKICVKVIFFFKYAVILAVWPFLSYIIEIFLSITHQVLAVKTDLDPNTKV